jgi:arylsulfatase A-like enzyme
VTLRPIVASAIAAGRALNALFFLATAVYCLLTFSPFAYEQFIQPHVVAWLSNFVLLYAYFYWLAFFITLLTLVPWLESSRYRGLAWAYLVAAAVIGVVLMVTPLLPGGNDPRRSLTVALAALAPVFYLAAFDHVALATTQRTVDRAQPARSERRIAIACAAAALFVWAIYAAAASVRLRGPGGVPAAPFALGVAASAVAHATVFTILGLIVVTIERMGEARGPHIERGLRLTIASAALAVVMQRVVLAPISIAGSVSWLLALPMSIAIVLAVSGISRYVTAALDGRSGRRAAYGTILLLPVAAYAALAVVTTFDWGFMLQKLSALAVAAIAVVAFGSIVDSRAAASHDRVPAAMPFVVLAAFATAVVAAPRLPGWLSDPRLDPDFAFDAYSAGDPAFRLMRQFAVGDASAQSDADFFAYLRSNSSIPRNVAPASVEFVNHFTTPTAKPPHIFLFLIDSLRRDYVAPYNPAVTFTPQLAAFAAESFVFERAFSRYGGTGLAVPSIWSGALVLHKQYVTPFAPMNALAKLLDAGGYRRVVTFDHITDELFGFTPETTMLDRNVPEMLHTFCGTLDGMKDDLQRNAGDRRPVFAHTRPLDLHIGNTRLATVPPGESYPGFFAPYAARVRRLDSCFGEFIAFLKGAQLYDDSIIVVMSDHGDSLGEGLRWGHGYTVFPEVMRIPLLIHLPVRGRERWTTDLARVSFATDVTPSLYALLGQRPERPRSIAGVPLFTDAAAPPPTRRDESFLVASSYGAVYGLVRHNGRRLYIADAIEGRDYLYDLAPTAGDVRISLTDAERRASRALIRAQVGELAAWYGLP